ncbi:MAG: urate hydroxylase PuuD [Rubrivivax sp.]|nr:urate hydroxylase PuuD [Rubrivivax sp.]
MEAYLLDWANLLLRWAHVITAIAWIGSSFYFVLLDNSLSKPQEQDLKDKGVDGEMWAVHGGGFYHSNKYMVAPRWKPLPENLHWSFWESYSTWLTGFALFTVLYLFNAGSFLVDKSVYDWSPAMAIAASLGFLVAFWVIYDVICRAFGQRKNGDLIVGVLVFAFVVLAAWLACQLFAGRAAFLLVGAMLATTMSANVFFWIIPGQRTVIADLRAGRNPDPVHGQRGKQRSVHNTYFTLPVIVAMLSNHYGWLYHGPHNWLVLVLLMLAGALIRHSFVARHKAHVLGKRAPWEHAVIGTAVLVAMAAWLAPKPPTAAELAAAKAAAAKPAGYAEVRAIVDQRCVLCHNAQVQQKNVALDTKELLKQHAQQVYQQASVLKLMPLNNATQITDAERDVIKRWYEAGASIQ